MYVRRVADLMAQSLEVRPQARVSEGMRVARKGTAATVCRVVVPARSDVCLPFAHASAGDAAQVSFTIASSPEAIHRTARYITTFDDPYGTGNLVDPAHGDQPPIIFHADDSELFVDVRVSVALRRSRCRWNTKSLKRHTARQSCIFSWTVSRWSRCLSGGNSSGSDPRARADCRADCVR